MSRLIVPTSAFENVNTNFTLIHLLQLSLLSISSYISGIDNIYYESKCQVITSPGPAAGPGQG